QGGTEQGGTEQGGTALGGAGRRPRTVALCHNVLPHERRGYDVALMRRLLRRVDGVLTHSADQAELARSLAPGTPVAEAEMPPHLPGASAGSGAPAEVHRRLLFFGIVRPYKGLDVLLRALAAGPPDVSLTVAGEFWGGTDSTRELITSLGLGDRVELREGYVAAEDVPTLFAQADALVLPYRSATASQNVWLGFEHGVPVIATRAGALADHIREGIDGLLCTPGDVDSLTEALTTFYRDGEPQRLRTAVRPVDPTPYWDKYLPTLVRA
ncbi:MAG: glycosyltransferase, partial [Streptosporangiales bacterium]|nr:glycosyltransferase [Streptosporangiales bacterium]